MCQTDYQGLVMWSLLGRSAAPSPFGDYQGPVQAPFDVATAQRLTVWLQALDEVHAEALRTRSGDGDPSANIAILHVLEQRAHEAFRDYRDHLLRP